MKKTIAIASAVLFIMLNAWMLLDSAKYFSGQPVQLLSVFLTAVGVGIALHLFTKLPHEHQLTLRILLLGATAIIMSGFSAWCLWKTIYIFNSIIPLTDDKHHVAMVLLILNIGLCLLTVGVWLFFYKLFKKRV